MADFVAPVGSENLKFLSYRSFLGILASPELWERLAALQSVREEVYLSLDGFDVVMADGLVALALLCVQIRRTQGRSPYLKLPSDATQLRDLKATGFLDLKTPAGLKGRLFEPVAARGVVDYSLLDAKPHPAPTSIVTVEETTKKKSLGALITYFRSPTGATKDLGLEFGEQTQRLRRLEESIVDVVKNVVEHSGSEPDSGWGFVVVWPRSNVVSICVADIGIGFLNSFHRRGMVPQSDFRAIQAAFLHRYNERLYSRTDRGLFGVAEWIRQAGGTCIVRSDSSSLQVDSSASQLFDENPDRTRDWVLGANKLRPRTDLKCGFMGVQYVFEIRKAPR